MNYHFKVHKEEKGYWAECIEIPSCRTQGESRLELKRNALEALTLHMSVLRDSNKVLPLPKRIKLQSNIIQVQV